MSSSVIDYFAVLGRVSGPLQREPFRRDWSDDKTIISATDVLDEAITDIMVLTSDQSVPDESWSLMETTLEDNQVDAPFIAIRRYVDSKRLDYITDIKLALPNEQIPEGFEVIAGAQTGSDAASLLGRGFLIIKRADASDLRHWKSDPIIDDIAFLKKSAGEEVPEKYLEVELLSPALTHNHLHGRNAADTSIVYHTRSGLGICDLSYTSATTDRYPQQDHDKLELPVAGLPLFAFPHGMHLTLADAGQFPLPLFFTFVFTDQDGKHFYVACLQFYEPVAVQDLQAVYRDMYGPDQEIQLPADKSVFCPKIICAVSQWPFYRAMRRFLRQLYSLSFSTLQCPLEYYIASVVHRVPFPLEGGRAFHVTLDVALISHTSKAMAPIEFQLPSPSDFPLMDVDFAGPLRCLSVEHLLAVYTLMLREAKLLFVCESNTMLTEVMETLRALLFPLNWASCFVPRLPAALTGLLQAPGGFMVGIHIPKETHGSTAAYLRSLHSCRSVVPGSYVVDLTANSISQYSGRSFDRLDTSKVDSLLKTLPFGPKFRLQTMLRKLSTEYSIGPQAVNLSEFDSAFELQSAEGLINAEKWENFPTVSVRDAFFTFLIDFLGDYSRYIIPPSEDLDADSYRTFQEEFSITQYLEQADKSTRGATELLLETQMFSALVQRRAEGRQQSLVLFERAGTLVRDLGLSAGGHGHHLPSRLAGEVLEMPVPVHGLLAADVQWASLGITRQQQLRSSAGAVHYSEGVASPASSSVTSSGLSGRHHLTYLSTGATGAMNVLRSGSIPLPHSLTQPVHNQRLDDLMTMWDFMNAPPTLCEKSLTIDAAADISEVQRVREELSLPLSELHLDNPAFGPLIIPGPCKPFSNSASAQLTGADPSSGSSSSPAAPTFSYQAGWPVLRAEFTDQALSCAVDPKVAELRALRHSYEQQTDKDVLLLVRPPGQRLSFEHHGKLINPARVAASEDVLAVVSMVVDIASLVLTCLSVRATLQTKPASDVLQMLGVLAQLEHWELLPALTDAAWRAVLVACAHGGGDLMRRVCCIVYQLIPSVTGSMPDSLTYGCFLRALAAKKRHLGTLEPISLGKANKSAPVLYTTPEQTEALLDPYLYLEEMGVTWYIQRSALQGQTLGNSEDSSRGGISNTSSHSSSAAHHRSAPVSPLAGMTGAMTKHLNLNKRFPVSLSFRSAESSPAGNTGSVDQRPLSIKPEAAQQTSGQFSLAEGPGMLVFSRPFTLLGVYPPRKVSEFSRHTPKGLAPGKLSAKLLNRMDQLYAGALPHIRFLPPAPLAVPVAPTMDRSDSTVTNLSVSTASSVSGDASPVVSHPGRMAQLSRAFFSKKTSASSPLPPAPLPTVVETSPATEKTGPGSHLPPLAPPLGPSSGSAPASPNPMMSWTSKLRPTMFFGGSPKTSHLHTPQQTDSHSSDVEMKEMSATLNFDDEDSGTEEEGGSDSESRGSLAPSPPPWTALPDADSSASVSPMRPEETVDTVIPPPPQSAATATTVLEVEELITPKSEMSTATESLLDLDTEDAAAVVVPNEQDLFEADPPVLMPVQAASENTEIVASKGENNRESPLVDASTAQPVDGTEPPLTAKALPVDVVTLQAQLLKAFEEEYAAQGRALGIYSFTPCPHCSFAMLDEEVLTRWCHGSAYKAHVKGNPRSSSARNMCAVHAVSCKQCAQLFSPQLHVVCYSNNSDSKQDSEVSDSLVSLWSETVSYLSPFGLRYELEALLMQYGAQTISTDWLHSHHPTVLWGLLWYSARLHLPSGLHHTAASHREQNGSPSPAQSYQHPVVVGWRECTIRAKAGRILQGHTADFLTVQELFPGCSEEDTERLENTVVPALDGSPAGMRIAMVSFCECASVVEYGRSVGMSVARLVSVGLLSICYLHGKKQYTIPRGFDSIAQLNKDPLFEKSFVDAIKCVLSSVDLQRMGTTETELLAACASKTVVIVRNTLGFLC